MIDSVTTLKIFLDYYNLRCKFYNKEIERYNKLIELYQIRIKLCNHILSDLVMSITSKEKQLEKLSNNVKFIERIKCKICYENISNCIFEPCLHMCCCYECIKQLENDSCPICRKSYENILKIFI